MCFLKFFYEWSNNYILTSISYALDAIFTRRAVLKVPDASIGALISVPIAVTFFLIILIVKVSLSSHSIIQKDAQSRIKEKRYIL